MKNRKNFLLSTLIIFLIIVGCDNKRENGTTKLQQKGAGIVQREISEKGEESKKNYKVTFIEIGSVKCIPCKRMQPIMKQIEDEYPDVKIIFYDVWKPEGRPYAQKYRIRVIPTQVFLNESGKEYFRHEGFYPKSEVEKILAKGGVEIKGEIIP